MILHLDVAHPSNAVLQGTWIESVFSCLIREWLQEESHKAQCLNIAMISTSRFTFAKHEIRSGSQAAQFHLLPLLAPSQE